MCIERGLVQEMIRMRAVEPLNKRIDELKNEIVALKAIIDSMKCCCNLPHVEVKPTPLTPEEVVEYQREVEDELGL